MALSTFQRKEKGCLRYGLQNCSFKFKCNYCGEVRSIGYPSKSVKPYPSAGSMWLRFCAEPDDCLSRWDADDSIPDPNCQKSPQIKGLPVPSNQYSVMDEDFEQYSFSDEVRIGGNGCCNISNPSNICDDDDDEDDEDLEPASTIYCGGDAQADGDDEEDEEEDDEREEDDTDFCLPQKDQSQHIFDAVQDILPWLPRVQPDGQFKMRSGDKNSKLKLVSVDEVSRWVGAHPVRGNSLLESAEVRSEKCKPLNGIWDDVSMNKVVGCFYVADVKLRPYLFEVFDFGVLRQYENCRKGAGVLLPCPKCGSNEHVHPKSNFSTSSKFLQVTYFCQSSHEVRLGQQYNCINKTCIEGNHETFTFSSWTEETIKSLPFELQLKYGGGGKTTKGGGYDAELGDYILSELIVGKEFVRKIQRAFLNKWWERNTRYLAFIKEQVFKQKEKSEVKSTTTTFFGTSQGLTSSPDLLTSQTWQTFLMMGKKGPLAPPTIKNVRSIFNMAFESIHQFLRDDLLSRVPGRFASSDGTFKVALRAGERCIVFVLGENGTIVRAFAASESKDDLYPLFQKWSKNLAKQIYRPLNAPEENALSALKFWYTDNCCQGKNDPTSHWLRGIFRGIERSPFRDFFHAIQLISNHTNQIAHEREVFTKTLSQLLRPNYQKDIEVLIDFFMKKDPNLSRPDANLKAQQKQYSDSIRRESLPRETMLVEFNRFINIYEQHRQTWLKNGKDGPPPLFSGKTRSRVSTIKVANNVAKCIKKGCLEHPLPVEEMYYSLPRKPNQRPVYRKKSESNKNENWHKAFNVIVNNISRIKPEFLQKTCLLRIHRFNDDRDIMLGLKSHNLNIPFWKLKILKDMSQGLADQPYLSQAVCPDTSVELDHEDILFECSSQPSSSTTLSGSTSSSSSSLSSSSSSSSASSSSSCSSSSSSSSSTRTELLPIGGRIKYTPKQLSTCVPITPNSPQHLPSFPSLQNGTSLTFPFPIYPFPVAQHCQSSTTQHQRISKKPRVSRNERDKASIQKAEEYARTTVLQRNGISDLTALKAAAYLRLMKETDSKVKIPNTLPERIKELESAFGRLHESYSYSSHAMH